MMTLGKCVIICDDGDGDDVCDDDAGEGDEHVDDADDGISLHCYKSS